MTASDMRRVHDWFLRRGLPLVLTRRVHSRALIERSAPVVSGIGAVIALTFVIRFPLVDSGWTGHRLQQLSPQ
jgi:hypothetical protein